MHGQELRHPQSKLVSLNTYYTEICWAVVAHVFDPSTWETESDRVRQISVSLQGKFQDSQGYIKEPCLENEKQGKTKQQQQRKQDEGKTQSYRTIDAEEMGIIDGRQFWRR